MRPERMTEEKALLLMDEYYRTRRISNSCGRLRARYPDILEARRVSEKMKALIMEGLDGRDSTATCTES